MAVVVSQPWQDVHGELEEKHGKYPIGISDGEGRGQRVLRTKIRCWKEAVVTVERREAIQERRRARTPYCTNAEKTSKYASGMSAIECSLRSAAKRCSTKCEYATAGCKV